MPILHVQYGGQGAGPGGSPAPTAPPAALVEHGPWVQVTVSVAQTVAQQLLQQGIVLPAPVSGWALIDTGAGATCIDEAVAQQLRLPVVDVVQLASASHAATQQNVYPVRIELVGFPLTVDAPRAIGAALGAQGLLALLGRDLLHQCTLFYNGPSGQLTLAM